MKTADSVYGAAEMQASRWRRIINALDAHAPSDWRSYPGGRYGDSEYIGDLAVRTVNRALQALTANGSDKEIALLKKRIAAEEEENDKAIASLRKRIAAEEEANGKLSAERTALVAHNRTLLRADQEHSKVVEALTARIQELLKKGDELTKANHSQATLIETYRRTNGYHTDRIAELASELEAEKRRGKASAQFRLAADKRWEGSYTKKVVDAVRSIPGVQSLLLKPAVDAAELLEDYHATQHEVWQRADRLEKEKVSLVRLATRLEKEKVYLVAMTERMAARLRLGQTAWGNTAAALNSTAPKDQAGGNSSTGASPWPDPTRWGNIMLNSVALDSAAPKYQAGGNGGNSVTSARAMHAYVKQVNAGGELLRAICEAGCPTLLAAKIRSAIADYVISAIEHKKAMDK